MVTPIDVQQITQNFTAQIFSTPQEAINQIIAALAAMLKGILTAFGVQLPPSGYVVVATVVLAALIYSLHKMTTTILKAIVIGVILAIVLHMIGML